MNMNTKNVVIGAVLLVVGIVIGSLWGANAAPSSAKVLNWDQSVGQVGEAFINIAIRNPEAAAHALVAQPAGRREAIFVAMMEENVIASARLMEEAYKNTSLREEGVKMLAESISLMEEVSLRAMMEELAGRMEESSLRAMLSSVRALLSPEEGAKLNAGLPENFKVLEN